MTNLSLLDRFISEAPEDQQEMLESIDPDKLAVALKTSGHLRPDQLQPSGDWAIWLVLAGRGFGKTLAGAHWVIDKAAKPGTRIALVGATLDAARQVMVEGESGLLARMPAAQTASFIPSLKRLTWANGSVAQLFSGGDPDSLRGGQFDFAWGDEFAHWSQPQTALVNLRMATRLGAHPQLMLTTTPLPHQWLKDLLAEPGVVVTRGRTNDNAANLPRAYLAGLLRRYGGSQTGRQELDGEIIDDLAGALWTRALIDRQRVTGQPTPARVLVGVDPPADGGTCGIVVVALGQDGHGFVLEDASVAGARPEQWARAVANAADKFNADKVIAEVNNGGAMVAAVLKSVNAALPLETVRASRGKVARAEPVAALYAEGRVFHAGVFPALEDQLCGLLHNGVYAGPGASPDRADALVWALTALMLSHRLQAPAVRVV
jgi:phage terminase large subunit-like protein